MRTSSTVFFHIDPHEQVKSEIGGTDGTYLTFEDEQKGARVVIFASYPQLRDFATRLIYAIDDLDVSYTTTGKE